MSIDTLPQSGFLSDASEELKELLHSLATDVTLASGDILFEEGDDGDALYALLRGQLELSVLSADGRKLSLDVVRPGALFGEIALFDPGPRTATATALEDTTLRRIRNGDLLKAIADHPQLAADLIRLAGQRMRWMNKQLSEQVFLPLSTRLARKVLYLSGESGTLSLSQAELAEFVGATREAVSKTLSTWKKQETIRLTRGGLDILDRAALDTLAGVDQF